MKEQNENVFYFNGVTVPFFRICGFKVDYDEDFSNDEDQRKAYPDLMSEEKLLNITLKISDSENNITSDNENISFPMPENLYNKEKEKYFKWLERHEEMLVKNGNGVFLNVAKNDIAETINKVTKESAKVISKTFDEESDKLNSLIERLLDKESKLDTAIQDIKQKSSELAEAQNHIIELVSSFNDNLTGFELLKEEEDMKEKDNKISELTGNNNLVEDSSNQNKDVSH
tara:strand:+ start:11731 stop:12417 length:687 start_codon:yes stop_codon:yes gene_type:complete